MKRIVLVLVAVFALLLVACSDSGSSGSNKGTLSLSITDAPVDDAAAVVVEFTGVELKPKQGVATTYLFEQTQSINLLALQNGVSASLVDLLVDAGEYNWIRLLINAEEGVTDSYIDLLDGSRWPLYIPSGAETGLKLHGGFVVAAGGNHNFTVDFNLRKSVHLPSAVGADYKLRPSLRIVDELLVGSIDGEVNTNLINAEGCSDSSAVYLYEGVGATTGEEGSANSPLSSANVEMNDDGGYVYHLAFVEAGEYTVAFTCQSADDLPDTEEQISIANAVDVTVVTDETVTVNF